MQKASLIIFSTLLLASVSVHASSHGNKQSMGSVMGYEKPGMAMKHANPLPNLMKVTMKFGEELNLSAEQKSELANWNTHNGPIMKDLVRDVIKAEQVLHSAALSNASQAELQNLMDHVLRLRLQVAKGKIRCRENMRRILNEQQWNKVVSIYKQKMM